MPPDTATSLLDMHIADSAAADAAAAADATTDLQDADAAVAESGDSTSATETAGEATAATRDFIERFQKTTGLPLDNYTSDEEAMRGLAEARRMVGQRSEDASRWQKLIDKLEANPEQMDTLMAMLRGDAKAVAPPPPSPTGDEKMPTSYEELQLWAAQAYDAQGKVRADVDPAMARRITAATQKLNQVQFDLAFHPERILGPILEKAKGEVLENTQQFSQQQLARQKADAQVEAILLKNSEALFIGGDRAKLTPFGEKTRAEFESLVADGMAPSPAAYQRAIETAQLKMPQPKPTKPVSPQSRRQPAVAAPMPEATNLEKRFRDGASLVEVLMEQLNAGTAQGG